MIRQSTKWVVLLFLAGVFLCTPAFAEESVCVTCHTDIAKDWKQSIHFKNGISCHNCHGGNPKDSESAMDPKSGFLGKPSEAEIPAFCGKCHAGVKENYLKSEHSRSLVKGGPSCVTCHTSHKQQRASINLIAPDLCGRCHSFERAEKVKNAMFIGESEITNLEERLASLRIQGHDVNAPTKALFAVRNKFHRLTHVVDVGLILKETAGIQSEIERQKAEISVSEKIEMKRKIWGAVLIVFLLLGSLVFWWYRNTDLSG